MASSVSSEKKSSPTTSGVQDVDVGPGLDGVSVVPESPSLMLGWLNTGPS